MSLLFVNCGTVRAADETPASNKSSVVDGSTLANGNSNAHTSSSTADGADFDSSSDSLKSSSQVNILDTTSSAHSTGKEQDSAESSDNQIMRRVTYRTQPFFFNWGLAPIYIYYRQCAHHCLMFILQTIIALIWIFVDISSIMVLSLLLRLKR